MIMLWFVMFMFVFEMISEYGAGYKVTTVVRARVLICSYLSHVYRELE